MKSAASESWLGGIAYEVAFWNNTYRWQRAFEGLMRWSHLGGPIELEGFDAGQYLAALERPRVLDVGAGLSFAPGNLLREGGEELDIHYVDPLADSFNRIAQRHGRNVPRVEFGMVEYLSAFYPAGSVDLVIVQNALDHSARPMKGIYEALETLRRGGLLYLNHHPDEAETEHYRGFHQHNITEENGRLIIWNREARYDVTHLLEGVARVETRRVNGHVVAVAEKLAEVPRSCLADGEDRRRLCTQLMRLAGERISGFGGIGHRLDYWRWNAFQFVAQAFPYETRMKIKKILRR